MPSTTVTNLNPQHLRHIASTLLDVADKLEHGDLTHSTGGMSMNLEYHLHDFIDNGNGEYEVSPPRRKSLEIHTNLKFLYTHEEHDDESEKNLDGSTSNSTLQL